MLGKTALRLLKGALVVVILLIVINYTGGEGMRLTLGEDLFLTVVTPVQGFFSRAGAQVANFFTGIFEFRQIQEENAMLREELAKMRDLSYQLSELQKENYRLRELLGFEERTKYKLLPAEVIARNPSYWFETITINKGSADGLEKNMAVVTHEGLVGSVIDTTATSARIQLLTDSRKAVSALVQRSREPGEVGIVEGNPELRGFLRMVNLPAEANIQIGDTIISSGLGGVFPKGLVIGQVVETGKDQYGLLQQAIIKPAVNFNRLEEVFVLLAAPNQTSDEEFSEADHLEEEGDGEE